MTKWFTSDLHHSHKRIVEFTNRGKDTTQENHDEWLSGIWNNQVSAGDLVYHLGDFSFAKHYEDIAGFVSKLNGQKIFIKGNHDDHKNLDKLVSDGLIQAWYDYKEIKIGGVTVCLFHFPIKFWHKQAHGSFQLHGHLHGADSGIDGKILDVGIDSAFNIHGEHRFFSAEHVSDFMSKSTIYVADHHKAHTTKSGI
jgi:calcineurin-like phosphoesterase family protein